MKSYRDVKCTQLVCLLQPLAHAKASPMSSLTNYAPRPCAIKHLEMSGYGIHSIVPHAPSLGLALTGRMMLDVEGSWQETSSPTTLYDIKPAPFNKFSQRLQAFRSPTLSSMARCTCFNTYIVSVLPYTASYVGLSTYDLNMLRQQAAKFILKRHWLEAEILPYVLRCVGIAPLLDPALVATVAATGLYFREGNTLEDLININMYPCGCNLRQRSVVRDLLNLWAPFVKLDIVYSALANKGGGLKGRLSRLKQAIFQGMTTAARSRLRQKIVEEGWSNGVSVEWLELTSSLKKKWCNGVARYTLLRWAVNQSGLHAVAFATNNSAVTVVLKVTPFPLATRCCLCANTVFQIHNITPIRHCPFGQDLLHACRLHFFPSHCHRDQPLLESGGAYPVPGTSNSNAMDPFRVVSARTRWCVIPLVVVWIILQPSGNASLPCRHCNNLHDLQRYLHTDGGCFPQAAQARCLLSPDGK